MSRPLCIDFARRQAEHNRRIAKQSEDNGSRAGAEVHYAHAAFLTQIAHLLESPAEIAAAHPKCGLCGYYKQMRNRRGKLVNTTTGAPFMVCVNGDSPSSGRNVNPLTDYCPHHSELTK